MSENAELWSRTDEESIRRTLKNYLERHFVEIYDEDDRKEGVMIVQRLLQELSRIEKETKKEDIER